MFKEKLKLIPHLPGSYQMKNKEGIIIYVGKAKDLHNRVKSYFTGRVTGKTKVMVSEIADFEYIITKSELEAFILEINLIKKYDPKYNILLRDDKTYPYIELIKKPYPKLKISRYKKIKNKKDSYIFGPYQNAFAARKVVKLLNRLYPLKKCSGNPKNLCLYYHIGECLGYCEKKIDEEIINKMLEEIAAFLKGNQQEIEEKIMSKIKKYSDDLNYEAANELYEELKSIKIILENQKCEIRDLKNRDIINYYFNNGYLSIQIFFLRNGKIVGSHNDLLPVINDDIEDIESYIVSFYDKHEIPSEILVPANFNIDLLKNILSTNIYHPQKGVKRDLINMVYDNAKINYENKIKLILAKDQKNNDALNELKKILNMDIIDTIEIFDNSTIFGNFNVSGMVVFKNGVPYKNGYRKFKLMEEFKSDYDMMKEVIYRRYYRLLIEQKPLPNLIIVDGGIIQINAACEVLKSLNLNIKVIGLKKNDKHKTSELLDSDGHIINIDPHSNLFHLLTFMQDEVHNFTISYHRQIRSKGSIASILDEIPGIGNVRKKELIKKFKNINNLKEAEISEISKIVPENIALNLKKYLENRK